MSRRLPALKPKQVIRALERHGFVVHRVKGSHYILVHPDDDSLLVTIAHHSKDLKRGTLQAIIQQAGLTIDDFLGLL